MSDLPAGTVTFLFTDIEGSSQLWQAYPGEMERALAHHDASLRAAIEKHGGHVVKMRGDGVHAVFASAAGGVTAALSAQRALSDEAWPQPIEQMETGQQPPNR